MYYLTSTRELICEKKCVKKEMYQTVLANKRADAAVGERIVFRDPDVRRRRIR